MDEIRERSQFLQEMRQLGRGKQHEQIIHTEVQQRMRRLRELLGSEAIITCGGANSLTPTS